MGIGQSVKKLPIPILTSGTLIACITALGLCTVYTDAAVILLVGGAFLYREIIGYPMYKGKERIPGKTVIITGANTGIGLETAKDLAERGGRIIMACRDLGRCEAAAHKIRTETGSNNIVCKKLDLASFKSIREFCNDINQNEAQLDILINNAGVMMCPKLLTEDGLEMQIGTNHFGHFLLTNLLLDKLKASGSSRIVIVSSSAHAMTKGINFEDINSEKSYNSMTCYAQSKLANVLHARELAKQLDGTGVTVYVLHPGVVDTELPRHFKLAANPVASFLLTPIKYLFKTPLEGAQTTLACALDPALETVSGKYYKDCKKTWSSSASRDDDAAKRLWNLSLDITKEEKGQ